MILINKNICNIYNKIMNRPSIAIRMNIQSSNNNSNNYNLYKATLNTLAQKPKVPAPTALRAPMVARIFDVRPGCGSCGKG
jgi:hypothetical protein